MKSRFASVKPDVDSDQSDGEKQLLEKQQELLMSHNPSKKKRPLIAKEKKQFDSADFFMKGDENGSNTTSDEMGQDGSQDGENGSGQKYNNHKSKMTSNFSNSAIKNQDQSGNGQSNQLGNDSHSEEEVDHNNTHHSNNNHHHQDDEGDNYKANKANTQLLLEQKRQKEEQEAEALRLKKKEAEEEQERKVKQREEEDKKKKKKEEEDRLRKQKEEEEESIRAKKEQIRIKKEQEEERLRKEKEERDLQENKRIEQERKLTLSKQNNLSSKKYALEEEDDTAKEQELMLMKKNIVKKPLVAKQKKVFDSADYYMKDEHNDDDDGDGDKDNDKEGDDDKDSQKDDQDQRKVIGVKTKYSKSNFNSSPVDTKNDFSNSSINGANIQLNQASKQEEIIVQPAAVVPLINFDQPFIAPTYEDEYLVNTIIISSQQPQSQCPDGMSPRSNILKNKSGSEQRDKSNERERKRVSFSLPSDKSGGNETKKVENETDEVPPQSLKINNVHSLKGSRFLRQPHGNVIDSEVEDNESKQQGNESKQQLAKVVQVPAVNLITEQEAQRNYQDQINKATSKLKQGVNKRKPLIAKDIKKVDFDSADYFLEEEKNKQKMTISMPELQIDDDEIDDQIHYMKIHIERDKRHRLSILANPSKIRIRSMPELAGEGFNFLNGDHKEVEEREEESPKQQQIGGVDNNNLENGAIKEDSSDNNDDYDFDDDDDDSDSDENKKGNDDDKPSVPTNSSIEDEDDFLPKIVQSKITNSKFQKYKNQTHDDDEDEEEEEDQEEEEKVVEKVLEKKEEVEEEEKEEENNQQETYQNNIHNYTEEEVEEKQQSTSHENKKSAFASSTQSKFCHEPSNDSDPEVENQQSPVQLISHQESEQLMHEQSKNISKQAQEEHESLQISLPVAKKKKNLLNKEKKKEFDSADFFMKDK